MNLVHRARVSSVNPVRDPMLCKMGLPVGPFTVHLAAIKSLMDETHPRSIGQLSAR